AVVALERRWLNREAAELGLEAIALLDQKALTPPIGLLRKTAELCQAIGDTVSAREVYGRAKVGITDALRKGLGLEATDDAAVLISHSRLLARDGQVDEALKGFEQAREILSQAGQKREVAVTLSDIARIKVDRGEVDEALSFLEEALGVFESLGD